MSNSSSWHIDKKVALAHLGITVTVAIAAFGYAITQHERLTRLEERQAATDGRIDRYEVRIIQELEAIRRGQTRMEDRIERLIER